MIFVTLGSQKFQFNRLLKKIDALIEDGTITEPVFAQTGASDYIPKHYEFQPFLDRETFSDYMSRCDMVITHGGTGAILSAVKKGKKVIAVPRLAKYGEHVDNHQLQLIKQFSDLNLICACKDVEKLASALADTREKQFDTYVSNTDAVIQSISAYIAQISGKGFVP